MRYETNQRSKPVWTCALATLAIGCGAAEPASERASAASLQPQVLIGPSVTVTPSQDLLDGQHVIVKATGYPANSLLVIGQCADQPTNTLGDCGGAWWERRTDESGALQGPLQLTREFKAYLGRVITCDQPGSCTAGAGVNRGFLTGLFADQRAVPLTFRTTIAASPQAGSVVLGGSTAQPGQWVDVSGTGWTPTASVLVGLCAASSAERGCYSIVAPVDERGAFSSRVQAARLLELERGLADCSSPGTCVVRVSDSRDPTLAVDAPLLVPSSSVAKGSASLDLRGPLVGNLRVRIIGADWEPAQPLRILQCQGPGFSLCRKLGRASSDASGKLRTYVDVTQLPVDISDDYCNSGGSCRIVVGDERALTATAVSIPLHFSEEEDDLNVACYYEPNERALLQKGVRLSGESAAELQFNGLSRAIWLLGAAGVKTGVHLPVSGASVHTTSYDGWEYRYWTQLAADHDYTLDELQKVGAIVWSWVLVGAPPELRPR